MLLCCSKAGGTYSLPRQESLLQSAREKLQVGAGCRSHRDRDAADTGRSGRLERTGTLFAVGSKPQPSVTGDGKETLLGIQRVLGSQEVTTS